MVDSECLRVFKERLVRKVEKQLGELDKDIEAAKRQAAGKGLSGPLINEVKGLCTKVLESRVDYIFEILNDLPFKYSRDLGEKISEISLQYFPSNRGEIYIRLDDIISFVNGEHARESVINEVKKTNKTEIDNILIRLDDFLLKLERNKKLSRREKIIIPLIIPIVAGLIVLLIRYMYFQPLQEAVSPPSLSNHGLSAPIISPPRQPEPTIPTPVIPAIPPEPKKHEPSQSEKPAQQEIVSPPKVPNPSLPTPGKSGPTGLKQVLPPQPKPTKVPPVSSSYSNKEKKSPKINHLFRIDQ